MTKNVSTAEAINLLEFNMTNEITQAILEQLGGHRFLAMTGVKQMLALSNGLMVYIPETKYGRGTVLKITLNAFDWYDLEVFTLKRGTRKRIPLETAKDVDCSELMEVVERMTGLYLTLHPRK